ncbi:phytanoyl-CoA dioxygenase family protein [Pelagibacterium montanilacus]|uniref:phytanoyl-CoA dioxygenase family protein n=1 Tax=Pelagibacterium montanilacus TaxID=2185280 RepID=UPI000F8C7235|nr:phytanoyl-CoA dioxygenase family protein [Pelagibacterium montanilacus]
MTGHDLAPSPAQIQSFITDGFVRIDDAFPRALADAGRAILWAETGCDRHNRDTWTRPVIRLGGYSDAPFREASNTARLHAAYDGLVGPGRWVPPQGLGTFPVRFPSDEPPGDDGWHIDVSFALERDDPADFLSYRANLVSRGRALLMLFLFSDVGEADAPTRIRKGSHRDIARRLAGAGADGMTLGELAANGFAESARRDEVLATGPAGTVYLCHPFLVHAAQPHRGTEPRFMAQPPLYPRGAFSLEGAREGLAPVERAIVEALDADRA